MSPSIKTIDQTHLNLKLLPYRYESKILLNIDLRNCASDIHNKLQCNIAIVFATNPDPIVSFFAYSITSGYFHEITSKCLT